MSYDIYLKDPRTLDDVQFDGHHFLRGGTYALGGTSLAWLNITYNYSRFFFQHVDSQNGIRALYGLTVEQAEPILEKAISELGIDANDDYWAATPGNAGKALSNLLALCKMAPGAVIDGD